MQCRYRLSETIFCRVNSIHQGYFFWSTKICSRIPLIAQPRRQPRRIIGKRITGSEQLEITEEFATEEEPLADPQSSESRYLRIHFRGVEGQLPEVYLNGQNIG